MFTAFDLAHVRALDTGSIGQRFLSHTQFGPRFPH
jgi:hypothetical protein